MFPVHVLSKLFLIKMHEIDTAAEVHLEPFQTYMIKLSCENSLRLKKKSSIIDNWHGSKYVWQLQR